jgi:RHS repeat-associated protein
MGATANQAGTVTIQFVNTHGDVYGTVASTATAVTDPSYAGTWTDEYGIPLGTPVRYDYLGTQQIKRDGNSGLMLMGQRAYNPETGRFLQTDPIIGGSSNNYDYTNGDPINGTDLTGQSSCKECDVWIWVAAYYRNEQIKLWNATMLWNDTLRWDKASHTSRYNSEEGGFASLPGPTGHTLGISITPQSDGGDGGCGGWTGWAHCSWHWTQRNLSATGVMNIGSSTWGGVRHWWGTVTLCFMGAYDYGGRAALAAPQFAVLAAEAAGPEGGLAATAAIISAGAIAGCIDGAFAWST